MQSRNNGSCTSPTTTGLQQHHHGHHGHHHQRGGRASGVYGDGSSASQASSGSSNINSNYSNNNSGSAAGGAARPSSLAGGAGGGGGVGAAAAAAGMRSKPEAVRRSKSQGAATHRYRDRLVRTLAFNSSLPVHHSADESAQPNAAALSAAASSSSSGAPHYAEYMNGSKMTDEQAALPSPLQHCRRNLLLLHRHQSAFTSLGTNVTLANPIKKQNKKNIQTKNKQNVPSL